jgi:hypothetical protein
MGGNVSLSQALQEELRRCQSLAISWGKQEMGIERKLSKAELNRWKAELQACQAKLRKTHSLAKHNRAYRSIGEATPDEAKDTYDTLQDIINQIDNEINRRSFHLDSKRRRRRRRK